MLAKIRFCRKYGPTCYTKFWPGCIKRCQFVVKVNILSSDLIGGYLTLNLNQPIKWTDFRLDALLADTMLTKLYATGPPCIPTNSLQIQ
jgi:hypothetical protein